MKATNLLVVSVAALGLAGVAIWAVTRKGEAMEPLPEWEPPEPMPGMAGVFGLVTDKFTRMPLEGVHVVLFEPVFLNEMGTDVTNKSGYYTIANISPVISFPEHSWYVLFWKDGYEQYWENITLYEGNIIVDVKLEPKS